MTTQDHNSPPDASLTDAEFDAYLCRDSEISQQYREAPDAVPPPSLDRAILSQAHAAAAATKRSRVLRWSGPLALAASVVVVVSLVTEPSMKKVMVTNAVRVMPPEPPSSPAGGSGTLQPAPLELRMPDADKALSEKDANNRSEREAAQPSLGVPMPSSRAMAMEKKETAKAEAFSSLAATPARQVAAPPSPAADIPADAAPPTAVQQTTSAPPAPAPFAAAAPESSGTTRDRNAAALEEIVIAGEKKQISGAGAGAGPRGTMPFSNAQQTHNDNKESPTAWLDRIRELRRAGRSSDADREWERFVKQYPDYVVDAADTARPPKK